VRAASPSQPGLSRARPQRAECAHADASFIQALGGVEALEHIELDRQERKNLNDDGTMMTEWQCDICLKVNTVDRPLCQTCSRLRFPGESADETHGRRSASAVQIARKQELRSRARESMAVVAATVGASKRLTAARRRLRAIRATLDFLEGLGKTLHSLSWCRESEELQSVAEGAEAEAAEATRALATLDTVYEERMRAKRLYQQARGAKAFADEKRNITLFEDFDEAKREAARRFNSTQKEYIRAVIARRDSTKDTKDTYVRPPAIPQSTVCTGLLSKLEMSIGVGR